MKILIVSNLYPPHYVGGYELHCSQVTEYLHRAGHKVRVLTSSYRLPTDGNGSRKFIDENVGAVPVERSLRHYGLDPQPTGRFYTLKMARRQLADARRFSQALDEFQPDIVNWWNLEGITKAILPIPGAQGIPDIHCGVADTWLIREYGLYGESESLSWFQFWQGEWGPWFFRPILRRVLARWEKRVQREGIPTRPFPNRPYHVWFVSEFMRYEHIRAGLVFASSEVIYNGVSAEQFYAPRGPLDFENGRLRLLYAGYIEPNRGLHTIVEALALLPSDLREKVELSIASSGPPKASKYFEEVETRIGQLGLSKTVIFLGKMRHDEMPRVYRGHHVLISATTRKEGLPLTMIEAMCAGCAVITTGSGGAIEVADRADLPIFPKEHPVALSRLIAGLVRNRELVCQIAQRGQEVALREFTFLRMAGQACNTFQMICERKERQLKPQAHVAE